MRGRLQPPGLRCATRCALALAALLALAFLLGGCRSGPAPSDRYYRLEPPAPSAPLARPALPGTLVVERPRSDALTGERRILYRAGPGSAEVARHAYSLWVDSPTSMIQVGMVHYLREAGLAERVVSPDLDVEGRYQLSSQLARLERVLGDAPFVEIELELALLQSEGGSLIHHGSYRAERRVDGPSLEAAAQAFRAAFGELLDRFVADVAQSVRAR